MGICQSNDTYYDEFVYDIETTPLKYMNLIDRQDIKRKLRMKKLNQREYDIYKIYRNENRKMNINNGYG